MRIVKVGIPGTIATVATLLMLLAHLCLPTQGVLPKKTKTSTEFLIHRELRWKSKGPRRMALLGPTRTNQAWYDVSSP
jgi:hypothetical protein